MGISEKKQAVVDVGFDSADSNKKWVIAGIPLRSPLKPIFTINPDGGGGEVDEEEEECSTTPTSEEARIPTRLTCPPAPRKPKPTLKYCNYGVGRREFFAPPDLETVFIRRHIEKAS